jgi:hypothetical protein
VTEDPDERDDDGGFAAPPEGEQEKSFESEETLTDDETSVG